MNSHKRIICSKLQQGFVVAEVLNVVEISSTCEDKLNDNTNLLSKHLGTNKAREVMEMKL